MGQKELVLKTSPVMKNFQEYIKLIDKIRGFDKESTVQACLLLGEEVGELFKAVRKETGMHTDETKGSYPMIEEEIADVFYLFITVANKFDIDIEKAFREKEEVNKKRVWKFHN